MFARVKSHWAGVLWSVWFVLVFFMVLVWFVVLGLIAGIVYNVGVNKSGVVCCFQMLLGSFAILPSGETVPMRPVPTVKTVTANNVREISPAAVAQLARL